MNQSDFIKMEAKDSQVKKKNGAVYGTRKGRTDFHTLESLPIESMQDKTLLHILDELTGADENLEDKIQILKQAILNQEERIKKLEKVVSEYVG